MKTGSHKNIIAPFTTTFLLLLLNVCSLKATVVQACVVNQDSIVVVKMHTGGKCKIKIYPNATHEVLFFTASGEENKVYQLFLFDVEGKLVKQTAVRNRQTGFLSKFTKGNYVYEVFSNDERIEDGSIVIK